MENVIQFWNAILPTLTFATLIVITWKASAYCTDVKAQLKYLKVAVVRIERSLFGESFTETLSPIALNENGQTVAADISADVIAQRLAEDSTLPKGLNPYQIQQYCMEYADKHWIGCLTGDEKTTIEEYAYQQGHRIEKYTSIFGILLRDIWLERRGYKIGEIDGHAPDHSPATSGPDKIS